MIIFLDTEFTDLVIEPQLLSVGMVASAEPCGEFYAEVTDRRRIHAASWFALDVVLPQFGRIAHASCSYATLGARVCAFVEHLLASSDTADRVDIAFSYDLDWELTARAMRDSGGGCRGDVACRLSPKNIYDLVGFGAGKVAAETYFAAEVDAPISRHHSLCDARALRLAYEAAKRPAGGPDTVVPFGSPSCRPPLRATALQAAVRTPLNPDSRAECSLANGQAPQGALSSLHERTPARR